MANILPNKTLLYVLTLALCLLVGALIPDFQCNPPGPPAPTANPSDSIKASLESIRVEYEKKLDALTLRGDSLEKELQRKTSALHKQQNKADQARRALAALIASQQTGADPEPDSLIYGASSLIRESYVSDSLCNRAILTYEEMIVVKDSAFATCQTRVEQTDSLLRTSISEQILLEGQLAQKQQELKRSKKRTRLVGAGLAFLTGLFILKK